MAVTGRVENRVSPVVVTGHRCGVEPLGEVRAGGDCEVVGLDGSGCVRLREMGFCEGARVRVLASGRNLVCLVCGTRLALSRALADRVKVVRRVASAVVEA
jgi:Fe2+ transport system protein FeoA